MKRRHIRKGPFSHKLGSCCHSKQATAHVLRWRTAFNTATDPDFKNEDSRSSLQKKGEETQQTFHYLPVSSFEHHSKGSVSNQIFPAVLEISHGLHCNGMVVQKWWTAQRCCSLAQRRLQFIRRVLAMLHRVLPIYFMVRWYVSCCIKKKKDAVRTWCTHMSFVGWDVCRMTQNRRLRALITKILS